MKEVMRLQWATLVRKVSKHTLSRHLMIIDCGGGGGGGGTKVNKEFWPRVLFFPERVDFLSITLLRLYMLKTLVHRKNKDNLA